MYAQQDLDNPRAAAHAMDPGHPEAVAQPRLLVLRWLAGRRHAAGAALAAAAWAATGAAALVGSHPGRGATAQIAFAAIMATFAMGENLLSPASPGAAGRYNRLGTLAFTTGCVLTLAVGALGADWGTSVLTTLAVACAIASSAVRRLGKQRSECSPSTGLPGTAGADNDAELAATRSESFAARVESGV